MDSHWDLLLDWIQERLRLGDVPRVVDIVRYAKQQSLPLSKKKIVDRLQLHPAYTFNMEQRRQKPNSKRHRPILGVSLGNLHCDIGFFSKSRNFETPPSFQSGFLVARDVLSRFVYIVLLRGNRKAQSMITAFEKIFQLHKQAGHTHRIRSISFDKETSVMSKAVQAFLAENHIKFVPFQMSSSKSKMAENAIRQIRSNVVRLVRNSNNTERWWHLMPTVTNILNTREIFIDGKPTGFTPEQVNQNNLQQFLQVVFKASPAYLFSQFQVDPQLVKFKFAVGSFVRAKLIVTSSAVLGIKRSETNLTRESFEVVAHVPYVAKDLSVGRAYQCRNLTTSGVEIFDEQDLVVTVPENEHLWNI